MNPIENCWAGLGIDARNRTRD
ncbi:hypothetical protein [Limnoraphis robusta]